MDAAGFFAVEFGHHFFRIGAALDGMDMIAVAGDHIIVTGTRGFHHAETAGFLAGVEVEKATDFAFDVSLIAAFFEAACQHHFTQYAFLVFQFHLCVFLAKT